MDHVVMGWTDKYGPLPGSFPVEYVRRLEWEGWPSLGAVGQASQEEREQAFVKSQGVLGAAGCQEASEGRCVL